MSETLVFLAWQRSGLFDLAQNPVGPVPRLEGTAHLELKDRDGPGISSADACFQIMGPGDVSVLKPQAIKKVYPLAYANDVETTKCIYTELAAADLPWRYTPQKNAQKVLRPWIVLVVGTLPEGSSSGDIEQVPGNQVHLFPDLTTDLALSQAARWAHIQIGLKNKVPDGDIAALNANLNQLKALMEAEGGQPIARLICTRPLTPNALHLAAVVPAFNPDGTPRWNAGDDVTVPAYHTWQFRTGPAGDFRILAARLRTALPTAGMGASPLIYDRIEPPADLVVRGALTQIGSVDDPIPPAVQADTAALTTPLTDPRGRPVVAPPVYGDAWKDDPKSLPWGQAANEDPRQRGSAGLGSAAAISLQETIVDAVREQAGAVGIAAQRIRQLTLGVLAASSLWNKRLPVDPMRRLALYGPSMRRMVTENGSVLSQIAGGIRPLPPAIFSSAARRALRPGPARAALAAPGAGDPSQVIPHANQCPPLPEQTPKGLPHIDDFNAGMGLPPFDDLLRKALESGEIGSVALAEMLKDLVANSDPQIQQIFENTHFIDRLFDALDNKKPVNYGLLARIVAMLLEEKPNLDLLARLLDSFPWDDGDPESLKGFLVELVTEPPNRPCRPVDLLEVEKTLTDAIDPTRPDSWIVIRVLNTIQGLDDQPLSPTEFCTGLDMAVWRFLRDLAPEWLLPGVGQLKADSVYPFESNPGFVDDFLLGINTQTLGELRWRNMPIATGCTPIKMFWGRIDPASDTRVNDVRDVTNWSDTSTLGDPDHQPTGVGNKNLVLVFRSDLFRRYPDTIVSAIAAVKDAQGEPQFDKDHLPDQAAQREWPVFQGTIGEDVTFFGFPLTPEQSRDYWFVLEEPPTGYRFFNDHPDNGALSSPNNGGDYARVRLYQPTRVLIKGGEFIPE